MAVCDDFKPEQKPAPAHISNAFEPLLQREQPLLQTISAGNRLFHQTISRHHIENRHADSRRQGIGNMGRIEQKTPLESLLLDLRTRHHRRKRQAGAERLRQRHDIRRHAIALKGEHVSGPADAGLRLIEDEQHAPLLALFLQGSEITEGQFEDTAARQDRFGNEGGEIARRLAIDQFEGIVKLRLPVIRSIGVLEARTIGIRRGNNE